MEQKTCLRCNHRWTPRTDKKPVQCPYCKSPRWDKARKAEIHEK